MRFLFLLPTKDDKLVMTVTLLLCYRRILEGRKRLDHCHCRPILGVLSVPNQSDDLRSMRSERDSRGKAT